MPIVRSLSILKTPITQATGGRYTGICNNWLDKCTMFMNLMVKICCKFGGENKVPIFPSVGMTRGQRIIIVVVAIFF